MLLATDVDYRDNACVVAGVAFEAWGDAQPSAEYRMQLPPAADYVPGAFYLRELPCILQLLSEYALEPDCVVVDGHVDLDADGRPGLGRRLFDALGQRIPVIGVGKTHFTGLPVECALLRGGSARPLFVTAAGIAPDEAKAHILSMHGAHRIASLLKRVDRLCRQ